MSNNDAFKQEVLELLGEEEERGGDVERELLKRFNSLAAKHTNSSSDERGKEVTVGILQYITIPILGTNYSRTASFY